MSDSTYEHNPGNGNMFPNPNQTPENNQPKYSGTIKLQDGKLQVFSKSHGSSPSQRQYPFQLSQVFLSCVGIP